MAHNVYAYILIMALVTYLIRALPLVLIRKEISSPFIRAFLHYVPYATLAAMTFPGILYSTGSRWSAVAGFAAALVLAWRQKSLAVVAAAACLAVLIVELLLPGLA